VLHRFGGVYVDCDMECLAPLGDMHGWPVEPPFLYAGVSNTGTVEVNNGLIGWVGPRAARVGPLIEHLLLMMEVTLMMEVMVSPTQRLLLPSNQPYRKLASTRRG
jgi:hypothetical protein